MTPERHAEYIVQCIREAGAMYEDDARQFLAEHDAHVLAETGQIYDGELLRHRGLIRVLRSHVLHDDFAAVKRALDEFTENDARDREKSSRATADATPDFFQPGHTYADGNGYTAPELITVFRVEHVARHPDRGHLRAIGWSRSGEPGAGWHGDFRDEGEFGGWTDITDQTTTGEDGRS